MRRIRLVIEYDGSNYVGWQIQPNGISIQERLEEALRLTTGSHIRIEGSGRTDSGVHARAQVAHFDTEAGMRAEKFALALNSRLPEDIRVLYSEDASEAFHARFSAKNKQYRYRIQLGPHARVTERSTSLHCHYRLNTALMAEAAADILGTHDFRAFMCKNTAVETTVRTITLSKWHRDGDILCYDVAGNGFLYNMVRILAGTMLEIGSGQRGHDSLRRALESGNRIDAGATAPAKGLTLWRVQYDGFDTETILNGLTKKETYIAGSVIPAKDLLKERTLDKS